MISKKSRISKNDFEKALLQSRAFFASSFTLRFSNKTNENKAFFSVVVPKKVSQKSVIRNKVRRRIYDIARNSQKTFKNKGFYMFFTKPGVDKVPFQILKDEVLQALSKTI